VHLYGRRQGYRRSPVWETWLARWISLETMLVAGGGIFATGFFVLVLVLGYWSQHHYVAINNMLPAVIGTTLMVIGAQNVLGGFLLGIINGHEAEFFDANSVRSSTPLIQTAQPEKGASRAAG
jgi:hypothetical protein